MIDIEEENEERLKEVKQQLKLIKEDAESDVIENHSSHLLREVKGFEDIMEDEHS